MTNEENELNATVSNQPALQPPDRIWLPADTDADTWNVLAKNPSRNWQTGEPANNIEYARVVDGVVATIEDDAEKIAEATTKEFVSRSLAENNNDLWQRAKGAEAVLNRLRAAKRCAVTAPTEPSQLSKRSKETTKPKRERS